MENNEYELKLTALYMEWNDVKERGTSSNIWTDGRHLNYIRGKIAAYKEEIEPEENLPGIYFHELPPVMKGEYVKDAEKIKADAKQALEMYLGNEDYKYIKEVFRCVVHSGVIKNERERVLICRPPEDILFHIEKFQKAVERKNYVLMKQYLDTEKVLLALRECRVNLEIEVEVIAPFK